MDKQIKAKLDSLLKYVPFIDYIVKIDKEKYAKFTNIRRWIVTKTRYPLSDLNKIEQSLITQYKNLIVLGDKEIPQEIKQIFIDEYKLQCINLCSEDEEEDITNARQNVAKTPPSNTQMAESSSKTHAKEVPNNSSVGNDILNDLSAKLLRQIDQDSEEDRKKRDKQQNDISVTYKENKRRKRRLSNNRQSKISPSTIVDIISLESSDEESPHSVTNNNVAREILAKDSAVIIGVHEKTRVPDDKHENSGSGGKSVNPPNASDSSVSIQRPTNSLANSQIGPAVSKLHSYAVPNLVENIPVSSVRKQGTSSIQNTNYSAEDKRRKAEEQRSILLNTLQPYEGKIASMWEKHKRPTNVNTNKKKEHEAIVSGERENAAEDGKDHAKPNKINGGQEKDNKRDGCTDNCMEPDCPHIHLESENESDEQHLSSRKSILDKEANKRANEEKNSIGRINRKLNGGQEKDNKRDGCTDNYMEQDCPHIHLESENESDEQHLSSRKSILDKEANKRANEEKNSIGRINRKLNGGQENDNKRDVYTNNYTEQDCPHIHLEGGNESDELHLSSKKSIIDTKTNKRNGEQQKDNKRENTNKKKEHGFNASGEKENAAEVAKGHAKPNKLNGGQEEDNKRDGCTDNYTEQDCPHIHLEGEHESDELHISSKKSSIDKEATKRVNKEKNRIGRLNRVFKELECSFKGYDQLQDSIPKVIGAKRRSSVHARTAIAEQLNCHRDDSLEGSDFSSSQSCPKPFADGKRRSSIYARSAIAELLNAEPADSQDSTDIDNSQSTTNSTNSYQIPAAKRRKTIDEAATNSYQIPAAKRRKTIDEAAEERRTPSVTAEPDGDINNLESPSSHSSTSRRRKSDDELSRMDISEDSNEADEPESELNDFESLRLAELKKQIIENQPMVVLERLSEDQIKKYTNRSENVAPTDILNVHLIESRIEPYTIKKSSDVKKALPKRPNNDSAMTERNTTFCTLCSSRPSNLTNHYIRIHKSESYVSRLTWSQLEELSANTPFAKVQPENKGTIIRYSVTCPFCEAKLVEPFMNLYNHYSTHTGEYAFECSGCQMQKPFRADIKSHQQHTKKCRNAHVQTMYRYPSNAMVIYLHYCTICYFVQLNGANILRHLRDHHDQRQSTVHNVQKCILAAINDGPDTNNEPIQNSNEIDGKFQQNPSDSAENIEENVVASTAAMSELGGVNGLNSKLDDDIPVCNEACSEEPFDATTCLLEEQLKKIHEDPVVTPPLHSDPTAVVNTDSPMTPLRIGPKLDLQIYNPNQIVIEDNCLITPPRPSLQKPTACHSSSKSTYRPYPSNVQYMGLYKCMADDCYYSTDLSNEILKHLADHGRENMSGDYLQCPYCTMLEGVSISSSQQLVDHIETKHQHMIYQCSMCCYRSCEASNVLVHQQQNHQSIYQTCKVFKCPGIERQCTADYIKEKILENVRKIQCPYCSHRSFYHSNLLEHHIKTDHKVDVQDRLENYSCIYCPLADKDKGEIRKHAAINHPEEFPYICSHNNTVSVTEDLLHNLKSFTLTQPVPITEVKSIADTVIDVDLTHSVEDIKPSAEELLKCQEETLKVRLRKLTEKTGVAPDSLYRCPEQSCGGFFTNYDLWLRHMRVKHHFFECQCPHCSTSSTRSLECFKEHFEEHRRNTYICFHCPLTFGNHEKAMEHASKDHVAVGSMRLEKIRFNISYSYFVLIKTEILSNRTEFIPALLDTLNSRLKEQYTNEIKSLKKSWLVSTNSSPWLEDYEKDIARKLKKKCFNNSCTFRATEYEALYKHVRENHNINGSSFNCSHCDFHIQKCQQWDDVLKHIKQHSDSNFFICGSCVNIHYTRSKVASHIMKEHPARDVPIINLTKKRKNTYLSLAIVFANECLSFSTMRNCFCCEERGMKGDAFILHLKRYHKFVLNYFCEWCNLPIESLQAVEEHYKLVHTKNKLKIRCELSSKNDLCVVSLHNLEVHIDSNNADGRLVVVKPELCESPDNDDSVIILEDDDIAAESYVKDQERIESNSVKPKLKCINLTNLLQPTKPDPPVSPSDQSTRREPSTFPRIKIVPPRPTSLRDSDIPISNFPHQQVAAAPSSNTNAITPNIIISPQYGTVSSTTGPLPTIIDRGRPNGESPYSHPLVTAPTQYARALSGDQPIPLNTAVIHPLPNESSTYSQSASNMIPAAIPIHSPLHTNTLAAAPSVVAAPYQNMYASTTTATSFLNSHGQSKALSDNSPGIVQNIPPPPMGGTTNHKQVITGQTQQMGAQSTITGMPNRSHHPQQHISTHSTISDSTNQSQHVRTLNGRTNNPHLIAASYPINGMTNQPASSTNRPQQIVRPSTTNTQHKGGPSTNQLTPEPATSHPQYIGAVSANSGMANRPRSMQNHTQHLGVVSRNHPPHIVGTSINHPQHIVGPSTNHPQPTRGPSARHPQYIGATSAVSGMEKQPEHIGEPPRNCPQHIIATSITHSQHMDGTSTNHLQDLRGPSTNHPQQIRGPTLNHSQHIGATSAMNGSVNHPSVMSGKKNQWQHIGEPSKNHAQYIVGSSTCQSQNKDGPSPIYYQHNGGPSANHFQQIGGASTSQPQQIRRPSTSHPQQTHGSSTCQPQQIHRPSTSHPQQIRGPTTSQPQQIRGPSTSQPQQIREPSTSQPQQVCGPSTSQPQQICGPPTNYPQTKSATSHTINGVKNHTQHIGVTSRNHTQNIVGSSTNYPQHIRGASTSHPPQIRRSSTSHPQYIGATSAMNVMVNYPHTAKSSTMNGDPNQLYHYVASSTTNGSMTTHPSTPSPNSGYVPESTISCYRYMNPNTPCESATTKDNNVATPGFTSSPNTNTTFAETSPQIQTRGFHDYQHATMPTGIISHGSSDFINNPDNRSTTRYKSSTSTVAYSNGQY